jgi:cytochrome P450 family 135
MRRYAGVIRDATDRAIDSWPTGQPFALLPSMQVLTFEVIARVLFGLEPGPRLEEFMQRLRALPDPFRRGRPALRAPVGSLAEGRPIDELLFEEIARRRAAPDLEGREDVLSMLIRARENGEGKTDQELRDDLVTLLLAGHETSAIALAWAFELLLRHPAVRERLEAELARGDEDYLNAVTKESLRLHPPASYVNRVVWGEPHELGGYLIPVGTEIRASVASIHRRTDYYPEPRAFRPERFLGPDPPDARTWLPFGGGVHRCIGASLAAFEMAAVIRRVLERTRLTPAERRPERAELSGLTQAPARGVRVIRELERPPAVP